MSNKALVSSCDRQRAEQHSDNPAAEMIWSSSLRWRRCWRMNSAVVMNDGQVREASLAFVPRIDVHAIRACQAKGAT